MASDRDQLDTALSTLVRRLLDRRAAPDHWDGRLASSALSTATAVLALHTVAHNDRAATGSLNHVVRAGSAWLVQHQNADGGWGDTSRSRSNISTTAIVWASLSKIAGNEASAALAIDRSHEWLRRAAGDITPRALRSAILRRYGKDRTFSVPILTVLALIGKLGDDASVAWRLIPQLPFELAAVPHAWFQHLRLPVVSYALPALIAIGQVRHHFAPSRNPVARMLRDRVRSVTHRLLCAMQPDSGGYLEATPLTSFVVMSLAGMGQTGSPVVEAGVRFLVATMRDDGSWPIDTNLATWVTTLSEAQNTDGGWGGSGGVTSSIEETGVVMAALGRSVADGDEHQVTKAVARGAHWLIDATVGGAEPEAAPLGLHFARLWYYEELYPVVFALAGLAGASAVLSPNGHRVSGSAGL